MNDLANVKNLKDAFNQYYQLKREQKRSIKRLLRNSLIKTTINLDNLSQNIFGNSITEIVKAKNWVQLSKKDKAEILSFYSEFDMPSETAFFRVVKHIQKDFMIIDSKIKGDDYNVIYRGKKHKSPGIQSFLNRLLNPPKLIKKDLFIKFDITASTVFLSSHPEKYPKVQKQIVNEIKIIAKIFNASFFMLEGDGIYFSFDNAYRDYDTFCNNIILFGVKTLQWLQYFNLYENPFDNEIRLRIAGISLLQKGDALELKKKAVSRLSYLEKKYIEPNQFYIDEFIYDKMPVGMKEYFTPLLNHDGLRAYYTVQVDLDKI